MFKSLMQKVDRMLGRGVIDDELYEELEEALLSADASMKVTTELIEAVRDAVRREKITTPEGIKDRLKEEIRQRMTQSGTHELSKQSGKLTIYLFVGVNGVGKTTTIGKLALRLNKQGKKVLLAAGDTFRAAAIEQLKVWADRAKAQFVATKPGGDAAGLAYEALEKARADGSDILLIDTAGRLQNKAGLMAELEKIARVIKKLDASAPHAVLLVLDATTGQNALSQVEAFGAAVPLTGLVMTKLDGTARGGILVALAARFALPVHYIGVGEGEDDLQPFVAADFARALVGASGAGEQK